MLNHDQLMSMTLGMQARLYEAMAEQRGAERVAETTLDASCDNPTTFRAYAVLCKLDRTVDRRTKALQRISDARHAVFEAQAGHCRYCGRHAGQEHKYGCAFRAAGRTVVARELATV